MTAHGILIKKEDSREADRVYTFYTKEFGRMKLVARGVRHIDAKLKAGLDLFTYSSFRFVEGRRHPLIIDVSILEKFPRLKSDFSAFGLVLELFDIFEQALKGEERDERIWNLILGVCAYLEAGERDAITLLRLKQYVLVTFLSYLGLLPELGICVSCGKNVGRHSAFSISKGGVVCDACHVEGGETLALSPNQLEVLSLYAEKGWDTVETHATEEETLTSLDALINRFVEYMLK